MPGGTKIRRTGSCRCWAKSHEFFLGPSHSRALARAAFDGYAAALPLDGEGLVYAAAGLPIGLHPAGWLLSSAMRPLRRRDAKERV